MILYLCLLVLISSSLTLFPCKRIRIRKLPFVPPPLNPPVSVLDIRVCLFQFSSGSMVTWRLWLPLLGNNRGKRSSAFHSLPLGLNQLASVFMTHRLQADLHWWEQLANLAQANLLGPLLHCLVVSRYLVLLQFLPKLMDGCVLVGTDRKVAAAYINRQGGLGSSRLCRLT